MYVALKHAFGLFLFFFRLCFGIRIKQLNVESCYEKIGELMKNTK